MSSSEWEGNEAVVRHNEEQSVLFAALDSFYQYARVAHYNTTHLRRQSFYALPKEHWELLAAPPFNYLETLNAVDDAIDKNSELAMAIFHSGLESFGLSSQSPKVEDGKKLSVWRGKATLNDLDKARSTLRQFYRDWSKEGRVERDACYTPVIEALSAERSRSASANRGAMRVLVPGAGLARLVFDLSCAGFNTEGNEISYHQLLASSYILNHVPHAQAHTLYPWAHSFSNHKSRANHLMHVQIPDLHPATTLGSFDHAGGMSMTASDFLLLYGGEDHKDTFDAVATVFFLDTAPNVLRYVEAIHSCLRTGGLLINIGPLLWHFENNAPGMHCHDGNSSDQEARGIADPGAVELTDDEVVVLIDKLGFDIEKREFGLAAPYIQDLSSMLQNTYRASHWVARKR